MKSAGHVPDFKLNTSALCDVGISTAKLGDFEGARRIATAIGNRSEPRKHWLQTKVLTAMFEETP